jgi:putative cardiolipin synthase
VRVRVLTNSLSSNDVVAAHSGYSVYRERLLESGVELHEVRADSAEVQQTLLSGKSRAALHTKAAVFDREAIFVGSFNYDPRSANLNTEIGLYAESPELAEQLAAFMDEGVAPHNSYALSLDGEGGLIWRTQRDGVRQQHDYDPATSFSQRFLSDFMTLLPIENQL